MPTFDYQGSFNDKTIVGSGGLCSSEETGDLEGAIDFSKSEDPSFVRYAAAAAGMSIISISCANKNKATDGASNIIGLSKGDYLSERTVEVWDGEDQIGQVNINGTFRKIVKKAYAGKVDLSGSYNSTKEPNLIEGYTIDLKPDGENKLIGSFQKQVSTKDGSELLLKHTQKYVFLEGTTKTLEPLTFELDIDTEQSFISADQGYVYLVANSVIFPTK